MQRIIKTIEGKNGRLYATVQENRVLIAKCTADIEIIEDASEVPILGRGRVISRRYASMLITFNQQMIHMPDIHSIRGFSFSGDFRRQDGVYRAMSFQQCLLDSDLDLVDGGTCTFSLPLPDADIRKLRMM